MWPNIHESTPLKPPIVPKGGGGPITYYAISISLESQPTTKNSVPKERFPSRGFGEHTLGSTIVPIVETEDFEPTPLIICHQFPPPFP